MTAYTPDRWDGHQLRVTARDGRTELAILCPHPPGDLTRPCALYEPDGRPRRVQDCSIAEWVFCAGADVCDVSVTVPVEVTWPTDEAPLIVHDEASMTPVGLVEIARLCGVTRDTVDSWRSRGVLPAPRWTVGGRPAWDLATIERWAHATGRHVKRIAVVFLSVATPASIAGVLGDGP